MILGYRLANQNIVGNDEFLAATFDQWLGRTSQLPRQSQSLGENLLQVFLNVDSHNLNKLNRTKRGQPQLTIKLNVELNWASHQTKRGQPQFKKWLASFGKKKQQCCSAMKFQRCMGIFILIIGFDFF
jgi:hypothetical protein